MLLLAKYKELLGEWYAKSEPHSISAWEMFFFYRYAHDKPIKRIVESGTYKGYSAFRLSLLFPSVEVVSFDKRKRHMKIARKRFGGPFYRTGYLKDNLDIVDGDTAVLIDGPKSLEAVSLAKMVAGRAAFVAVHDVFDIVPELEWIFDSVIHSGNPSPEEREIDIDANWGPTHYGSYYGGPLAICK